MFKLLDTNDARTSLIVSQSFRGNIARFVNSPRGSERANTVAIRRNHNDLVHIFLVLKVDVKEGEQILYTYGPDYD